MSAQIQSIQRAAAVLRPLSARSGRRALAGLASELDLPRGTVYGIVRTLQTVGFVAQDSESGKYLLGAALLHIGARSLDGNELRRLAVNWAEALATRLDESVLVGMLHDNHALVVHQYTAPPTPWRRLRSGTSCRCTPRCLGKSAPGARPAPSG